MIGLATTEVMQMPGVDLQLAMAFLLQYFASCGSAPPSVGAAVWSTLAVCKSSCDYVVLLGIGSG